MIVGAELAGFFAAHAVWSLTESPEGLFVPMLAYGLPDQRHVMERFADLSTDAAVIAARQKLHANEMKAADAVALYDGRVQNGSEKVDAILAELRCYAAPEAEAMIAVPYTPKSSGTFRIHIPLLVIWKNCEAFNKELLMQTFFKGVNGHEQGSRIWNASFDESR